MPRHPWKWVVYNTLLSVLGDQACSALITNYGGQRIWVPIPIPDSHKRPTVMRERLTTILGTGKAQAFFELYGGQYLEIPTDHIPDTRNLRREVAELHRKGTSVNKMAAISGVSRRTIFRWLNLPISELTHGN